MTKPGPYVPKKLPTQTEWMAQAACRGKTTRDYYPEHGTNNISFSYFEARNRCSTCPVADDCLEYAVKNLERDGTWGGVPPRQRRQMYAMPLDDALVLGQKLRDRWDSRWKQ